MSIGRAWAGLGLAAWLLFGPAPGDVRPAKAAASPARYRIEITQYTKVFAPGLSGSPQTCQVTYRLVPVGASAPAPAGGSVALQVYKAGLSNAVFAKRYALSEVTRLDGHTYRLRWDGRPDGGPWASGGRYRFTVRHWLPDGTALTGDTPQEAPMHLVHIGITEMDFVDYDSKDPRYRAYPLMFNEKSETDPTDVGIDVEWQVPDIHTAEAGPSSVYTEQPRLRNWPVCYVKGGRLRVRVRADGQGYGPGSGLRIRLASPDCVGLPGGNDENDVAPGKWYGLQTKPGTSLPAMVNKHPRFALPIHFYYLRDGKEVLLGTQPTTHVLYTVNAPPGTLAKAENGRTYVTVVDQSCAFVAGSEQIFASIWGRLWNIRMEVPGGTGPLRYDHRSYPRGFSLPDLLDADPAYLGRHWGRCSAWAAFHAALLAVQGEPVSTRRVVPRADLGLDMVIFRRELPGQNNPHPSTLDFYEHRLVEYRGRWYDPSYHLPKSSTGFLDLHAWEQAALQGYNSQFRGRVRNDPNQTEVTEGPWWAVETSEATLPQAPARPPAAAGGAP